MRRIYHDLINDAVFIAVFLAVAWFLPAIISYTVNFFKHIVLGQMTFGDFKRQIAPYCGQESAEFWRGVYGWGYHLFHRLTS